MRAPFPGRGAGTLFHTNRRCRQLLTSDQRLQVRAKLAQGLTQAEIAQGLGVSRRTVARIAKGPAHPKRKIGRPKTTSSVHSLVMQLLNADPETRTAEVLRQARLAGYTGGKSAIYDLVRSLRDLP